MLRRDGRAHIEYLVKLVAIPKFVKWMKEKARRDLATRWEITDVVQNLFFPIFTM